MANTIRIKRSTGSSAPTSLANAEVAYSEGSDTLWYGTGTGGAGGTATSIEAIGGSGYFSTLTTAQSISGNKTYAGTLDFSGATIAAFATTGNVTVGGNLTVSGTTTTVESTTVTVKDKNLELGTVSTPTDTTADGGGITLKGATDKTINWIDSTDCWTSSEHFDLVSGKIFKINGTSVLSGSTLGSGVTASSLTSVGTLTSGTWNATTIAVANGGTGVTTLTGLVKGNGSSAFSAAVAGTDYLSPSSTIDGGTF